MIIVGGIYILESKEGYRISYVGNADALYGRWSDKTSNWLPNGKVIAESYGNSDIYDLDGALQAAEKMVLEKYSDVILEDGISIISNWSNLTYEEITNGQKEKVS